VFLFGLICELLGLIKERGEKSDKARAGWLGGELRMVARGLEVVVQVSRVGAI